MGSTFSYGEVLEGAYKGCYVHCTGSNQLSLYSEFEVKDRHLRSGKTKAKAVIDKTTVTSIELQQEREKGSSAADVGGAALLLGPIAGAAMYADGKQKLYYVRVNYKNGVNSLLKLKQELYDVILRIKYETDGTSSPSGGSGGNEQTAVINVNPDNIEPTLTRIELFIEDADWWQARQYCNAALDYFPTDYRLYKYLLLIDNKCKTIAGLKKCEFSFASNPNYKKLERYADDDLKKELKGILEYVEKEPIYKQACGTSDKKKAIELFSTIKGYKDSKYRIASLRKRIQEEEERKKEKEREEKEQKYEVAIQLKNSAETVEDYKKAIDAFEKMDAYKDSHIYLHQLKKEYDDLLVETDYAEAVELLGKGDADSAKKAKAKLEPLKEKNYKDSSEKYEEAKTIIDAAKAKSKKTTTVVMIVLAIVLALVVAVVMVNQSSKNKEAYADAVSLYESGDYENAKAAFDELGGYEDSREYSEKCAIELEKNAELQEKYEAALDNCKHGNYDEAISQLKALGGYSDSKEQLNKVENAKALYDESMTMFDEGDLCKAKISMDKLVETGLYDEEKIDILYGFIHKYGSYSGTFVFKSGKNNAITQGGQGVDEIKIFVTGINTDQSKTITHPFSTKLRIEYDGGTLECERLLTNETHGFYYYMNDTRMLVEDEVITHYFAEGGEGANLGKVIVITDTEGQKRYDDYQTSSGYYERKNMEGNEYEP